MYRYRIMGLLAIVLVALATFSAPAWQNPVPSPAKIVRPLDLDAILLPNEIPNLRLKVDFLPQVPPGNWPETANCLPACFAMLYAHQQTIRPTPDMIKRFNDWAVGETGNASHRNYSGKKGGYSLSLLPRYAKTLETGSGEYGKGNLPLLAELLGQGKPVIVSVKRKMDASLETRHAMVVVGIDSQNIYVNDPGSSAGKNRAFPLDKFIVVWRSGSNRMFHL